MNRVRMLLLSCLLASWAAAQQYPFIPVPGSPKSVRSLFQDSRGRLWMAGEDLACFDGARVFFLRDYGFPSVGSYQIAEDSSGALWIASDNGVYRFAKGRFEKTSNEMAVNVIPVSPTLVIAAAGPPGKGAPPSAWLLRIQRIRNTWKSEVEMDLESPGALTLDHAGMLLYPWPSNGWNAIRLDDVVHWHPGSTVPVEHHPVPKAAGNGGMKVLRDRAGCLWLGAVGGNAYDCGKRFNAPTDVTDLNATMREADDGSMVLSGYSTVAVGRPGAFRVATRANGLPGIEEAIKARDGTVWLGSNTGLYRFPSPFRIEYWTIREGLMEPPWSAARMNGRIYAGSGSRIYVLSRDRSHWEPFAAFEREGLVSGLLDAGDGTLVAALNGGGAVALSPNGKIVARTEPGRPTCCSIRLARTADGAVWLGGHSLGRISRTGNRLELEEHPLQTQPSSNVLGVKYEAQTHRLWACYSGGLVTRDDHGAWKEITTRDGLTENSCWSVAPLPNGDVWYAYYRARSIARVHFDGEGRADVRQFTADDGIEDPANDVIDADRSGRLWRSAERGIYVADPAQAEAGHWLGLDQSDGFPANDINSGSLFTDSDGSLWWGADNDLAHFLPPSDLVTPAFAPNLFLSAFSWNGAPPRMADSVESLPLGSRATAHMGSLQFDRRNGLRLRYRILPEQKNWRETASLDLPLGPLASGGHALEVQARLFTGPWSQTVSWPVTVLRPAWLAWPLVFAYGITTLLIAAGSYWLYRARRADEAQLLPDLAPWRMGALLRDVHDLNGTVLDDRFQVGDLLARGGFAYVLAGYDRKQRQRCAIKVFRNEVKERPWVQRSFRQEVAALEKVRHPNVVTIYAHGHVPSGAPYLVMEFIEGRSLREALERGPFTPRTTARLLRQLGGALDAIHAQGICHRDVKPENIILRAEAEGAEQAVLIDFSIAIVKDASETLYGLSRAAGTFDYMGPEQAIGYAQSSSDIYSLAKTAIELLTGQQLKALLPDAALDLSVRVRELMEGLGFGLSPESVAMLAAALEFDPSRRPSVAGAFVAPIARDLERDGAARSGASG